MKLLKFALAFLLLAVPTFAQGGNELHKLTATDGAFQDALGARVAVDGNLAVAGAKYDNGSWGAAYLFRMDNGVQQHKLLPNDGALSVPNFFGFDVGINDNTVVVGSPESDGLVANSGAAYLFSTQTGSQTLKLTASDGAFGDNFGIAVDMSNTLTIVGASYESHPVGGDSVGAQAGAAYIFDTVTGVEVAKIQAEDGFHDSFYGDDVAINNDWALVGAFRDSPVDIAQGAVYVYDLTNGLPYQETKIIPSDHENEGRFGSEVALSGDYAIIAAEGSNKVYVFDLTTGLELYQLSSPTDLPHTGGDSSYGSAVAAEGDTFVVGASNHRHFCCGTGPGAFYVHDLTTGQLKGELTASDGAAQDRFGEALAITGNQVLVGASGDDDNGSSSGSAYTFEVALGHTYCSPAEDNSNNFPATIEAYGSTIAAWNYFELRANMWVSYETGYIMASMNQDFIPFPGGSEGNLCLGSGKARFTSQAMNGGLDGKITVVIDLTNIPTNPAQPVLAGQNWNWQLWYRDGTESNFSDAVSVNFN